MKKFLSGALAALMLCGMLAGCGNQDSSNEDSNVSKVTVSESEKVEALEEAKDFEAGTIDFSAHGISCKIPNAWSRVDGENEIVYFYPSGEKSTFLMLNYSEDVETIFDDELSKAYLSGLTESIEHPYIAETSEQTTSDGTKYKHVFVSGAIDGRSVFITIDIFDCDKGILSFSFLRCDETKDYMSDYFKIIFSASRETNEPAISEPTDSLEPANVVTMGQKNALAKAKDYLAFTAFSYSGLIEQLEYEGFSTEEATYGADNCGADWNEQAAQKAKDYLDFMSFSRSGLIEQLVYEGFTQEQAEYGVTAAGY